ncbi:MAG: biotin/lipoyl-binding protein [Campylobacterales bacterium]
MKKFILMIALAFSGLHAESIYATFDVEPEKTAELSLTTSGTIKGINVDVGSKVKKGNVLLWLDNRDLKAALVGAMIKVLLRLQSAKENTLKLKVDQKYWKQLKPGLAFVYKVDGDPTPREGRVSKVYPTANSANRKIVVEVPARGIVPGLFGEGEIEVE